MFTYWKQTLNFFILGQSSYNTFYNNPHSIYENNGTEQIVWCTVTKSEQKKCENLAHAIERDKIRIRSEYYRLNCTQAFSKDECMTLLDEEKVHVTTLDAGEVFIGGRYHSLIPIMQEVYEGGFNTFYSVAVIKKNTLQDVTSLRDLRGKSACFPNVGSLAGWVKPIHVVRFYFLERNLS